MDHSPRVWVTMDKVNMVESPIEKKAKFKFKFDKKRNSNSNLRK
jgi:hypothetical protein